MVDPAVDDGNHPAEAPPGPDDADDQRADRTGQEAPRFEQQGRRGEWPARRPGGQFTLQVRSQLGQVQFALAIAIWDPKAAATVDQGDRQAVAPANLLRATRKPLYSPCDGTCIEHVRCPEGMQPEQAEGALRTPIAPAR